MRGEKMNHEKFDPIKDKADQNEIIDEDENDIGDDIEIIEVNPDELPAEGKQNTFKNSK
jgi:hypothetical protein